ncbi:MAG: hypothetical protein ABL916_17650 [Burkholderiaceae bacterium]
MFDIPNKAAASYPRQAGGFSADIDTIAQALAGDGVLSGLGVAAQGSPDMTVAVAGGLQRQQGYFAYYAGGNATVTAAHSTLERIDLIVIDWNGAVSCVAGTAAAFPVPPDVPANSLQLAQVYVPATVTAITNAMLIDKRPTALDFFDLYDEFTSQALVTTGNISALAWALTAATGGTPAFQAAAARNPGVLRIVTGAASGNNQRLHLGASATGAPILPANLARLRMIASIATITTGAWKLGAGVDLSDPASSSLGSAGAFIEFVPATSLKWAYVTRQASASTRNVDTGADVVAGSWYQFDIVRLQNGNIQFAKNGVLAFTHTTNLPTTALNAGFLAHTLTTAARNLDIDAFGLNFNPLGNRFT